jgi:hypothetical protein
MPSPSGTDATRAVKKARPSFDVARDALDERRDAWVYRSDGPPPAPAPPRVVPSAAVHLRPSTAAPSTPVRSAPGWIGAGLGVMAMPFTLAIMALMAPAAWICGSRPRR